MASGRLETVELERATTLQTWAQTPGLVKSTEVLAHLLERFDRFGRLCVFDSGAARAEDFRRNQGQGAWAEQLLLNARWVKHKLVPFGPSDDVLPNEPEYELHRLQYREVTVLEGKRPDLLLFPDSLTPDELVQLSEWPDRPLLGKDRSLMGKCIFGIEMKSSLKHYQTWRKSATRPLSITVKEEEIADIDLWVKKFSTPMVFTQSFVDELYIASYSMMKRRISKGSCTLRIDPQTKKGTYFFPISESELLIGRIEADFTKLDIGAKGNVSRPQSWPSAVLHLEPVDVTAPWLTASD